MSYLRYLSTYSVDDCELCDALKRDRKAQSLVCREKKPMKVWITKYALTRGIIEEEAVETHSARMIGLQRSPCSRFCKPYWHTDPHEAAQHARQMQSRKIASLEKQIENLKKKIF